MEYKQPPPLTEEEINDFVQKMKIARFCSLNKDGSIHAVPVWYAFKDGEFIIGTPSRSQKARNVMRDNRVTLVIDNQEEQTKGVIIYGRVEMSLEDTKEAAVHIFRRYMSEEKAVQHYNGLSKIAKFLKLTVKPYRYASFDYDKDKIYRKAIRGEL